MHVGGHFVDDGLADVADVGNARVHGDADVQPGSTRCAVPDRLDGPLPIPA
ncbi:hypothetical protein [Mycobacterium mantenii]|uniref:hypothetical protein n=1 Tax=Mycobacterium mantenii TaxID=560555 RepID=UPI001301BB2F|nr:hypothetical protein [Mycobacterium mantenii]